MMAVSYIYDIEQQIRKDIQESKDDCCLAINSHW